MIQLKNISRSYKLKTGNVRYDDFFALNNINVTFSDHMINGITGSSGSGKTTLANVIVGYDKEYSGQVLYGNNKDQNYVRYVFQDPYVSMNPVKTVSWHIETACSINRADVDQAVEKTKEIGLDYNKYRDRYIHSMSGGELQKLALTISLISDPSFVVLDEAFSMMDSITLFETLNYLKNLKTKISVIYIDHDIQRLAFASDRIFVMEKGQIVEEDYTESIMERPQKQYTKDLIKYSADYHKRI